MMNHPCVIEWHGGGFLLGLLIPSLRRSPARIEERTVYGLPVLALTAPVPRTPYQHRRLGRALDRLHRAGAGEVLTGDFSIAVETLTAHGLRPVDPAPLRQVALPQLLDWMAAARAIPLQGACVALSAPQTSKAVYTAAEVICASVRYIALQTGRGQGALEDHLRRRWGVAPGGTPQLEVTFCAHPRTDAPALLAGEGCAAQTIRWRTALGQSLPEEVAAALWSAKKCQIGEIHPEWVAMRT